jgi:uncharacterized membrane protein YedE/YeeE
MIKSPHLRALIKMVLLVAVIGGIMMGIGYGLNYIYIAYGFTGITKLFASIAALGTGIMLYTLMLDEEKRKDKKDTE